MANLVVPTLKYDASYDAGTDTVTLGGSGILQGEAAFPIPVWDNVLVTADVKWNASGAAGDAEFMVYVGNDDFDGFAVTFAGGQVKMYYANTQVGTAVSFPLPLSPTPVSLYLRLKDKTATLKWGGTSLYNDEPYPMWDGQLWKDSKVGFWMSPAMLTTVQCTVANVSVTNCMRLGTLTWVDNDLIVENELLARGDVTVSGAVDAAAGIKTAGVERIGATGVLTNVTLDASRVTGVLNATQVPSLDASKVTTGAFAATQIPSLDASKVTTGTFATAQIPSLDAGKITTGTFGASRIPNLDAGKITTGTMAVARLPAATTLAAGVVQLSDSTTTTSSTVAATSTAVKAVADALASTTFAATQIPNLDASKITTGTVAVARLPAATTLAAGVVQLSDSTTTTSSTVAATSTAVKAVADSLASTTFAATQIPNLDASKITTGTFATARIPNLDASKVTTGTFTAAQIPNHDANKITTGTMAVARLPAATTTTAGVTQLSDSTSTFSSTVAATSTAVKMAWDLANNAVPRAGGATEALIVFNNTVLGQNQGSWTYIGWGGTAVRGHYYMTQTLFNIYGPDFTIAPDLPGFVTSSYRVFVEFQIVDTPPALSSWAVVPKFTYSIVHFSAAFLVNAHMTIVNNGNVVGLGYWGYRVDVHFFVVPY